MHSWTFKQCQGEKEKQSTGYSFQRQQLSTRSHAPGAAALISIWVTLQGFFGLEMTFFLFFTSCKQRRRQPDWVFLGNLPSCFVFRHEFHVDKYGNNTRILTLQPMVSYLLSATPQPGAAWDLPPASLTLSCRTCLWSGKRTRSPETIKFEVFLLKLLQRYWFNTGWSEADLQVFCFCRNQDLALDINLRSGMQLLFLQKLNLWT